MKLIDADALKEYVKKVEDYESAYTICAYIDNAPTVELTETDIQEVLDKRCMTAVANEYLIALHGNRTKGEWKEKWIDGAAIYAIVHCSNCGEYGNTHYKYCPNCGAQMKGVTENG